MDITNTGLHLIDTPTWYSASKLIKTKNEKIISNIVLMWIYFGSPKHFLSDNEGEFNNEGYQ